MAKWRELGEVPDSDEESLLDSSSSEDSQRLELPGTVPDEAPASSPPPPPPPLEAATPQHISIWDIPPSSPTAGVETDLPSYSNSGFEIHIRSNPVQQEPYSSPLSTPDVSDDEDTLPPLPVQSVRFESPVTTHGHATFQPNPASEDLGAPKLPGIAVEDDEAIARRESARLGRSLRPRKPIQEHPYLLENAQYSSLFKTHGIRPVRLPTLEERPKAPEDDSQEQDYEEDSQLTNGDGREEQSHESRQTLLGGSFDDDRDELALSSPVRPSPSPEPQAASQDALNSSQNDDDDLPSLGDMFKMRMKGRPKTYAKRKGSPKQAPQRKTPKLVRLAQSGSPSVRRHLDMFDIPPSPPQTSPAFPSAVSTAKNAKSRTALSSLTPKPSSNTTSTNSTPAPVPRATATIDLTAIPDLDSEEEGEAAFLSGSEHNNASRAPSSSPGPDMAFQRRIRGVLPASWIRLDQQVSKPKVQRPLRHSPERSPEKANRKGVAQRRLVSPKHNNEAFFFSDDESDHDETNLRSNEEPDISGVIETTEFPIFLDDAGSVIEEDHIDHMLPGRKRASVDLDDNSRPAAKRAKIQKTFSGHVGVRKRQQRITGMLSRSESGLSLQKTQLKPSTSKPRPRQQRPVARRATPPRLSILDVVEPDAPRFVKLAARAAGRRVNKGKASPSGKIISLGTRQDNVDALGVLRDWRNGKIPSRTPSSAPVQYTTKPRPLQPISDNLLSRIGEHETQPVKRMAVNRFSRSRKLITRNNAETFVEREAENPSAPNDTSAGSGPLGSTSMIRPLARSKSANATARPAQLETVGNEQISGRAFHVRKRALDAIFRKNRRDQPSSNEVDLEQIFRGQRPKPGLTPPQEAAINPLNSRDDQSERSPQPRRRKLLRPRHVDIAAPQYVHASDPLPDDNEVVPVPEPFEISGDSGGKLLGLGPYGTHYTQHFEVFPLQGGVFFHESTLIGQGKITKAFEDKFLDDLAQDRGHCGLILGDQPLQWAVWNAQTSSEFGVLHDWIADQLQNCTEVIDVDAPSTLTAVQAAEFILKYVQEIISLPDTDSGQLFVRRILEVISSFLERLSTVIGQLTSVNQVIEVQTRCILVVLQTLRICEKLAFTEALQVEELLKKTAKQTASTLLRLDIKETTSLLHELQGSSARFRGIRSDKISAIGWVTLMRVLQRSQIPRASFWDIVSSVVSQSNTNSTIDVQALERSWHTIFAILPLGEFDDAGVIVPGLRNSLPLEGWTLPQKLLTRVFDSYKTNQRQSPSFNDYCRALVSRCHYLIEQWGWRKCSSIIGTIFDFFASQNLSHLRNEEVYKSPQFLEDLAGTPSLVVQPEDRCFHIFLKLLALSVQRLRRLGLIKDVKNLIARVLPNHDRQYLKESDVHVNELSSLRNHHDLLCTLFWCSPQALRPSAHTLEKLVMPGSAHKEACLINLRAWNQLARFIVANGEDGTSYKPFADWSSNVFSQVLDQYSSVETDIQQQFLRMTKDASKAISPEIMQGVINMNKQAAVDVLYHSLKAILDVMQHTRSLASASAVLNTCTYQLHEVFTRVCATPPELDWSTQGVAVDMIDYHIDRIHQFVDKNRASNSIDSWHGEDAITLLDRHVSVPFFIMAQKQLVDANKSQTKPGNEAAVRLERTIVVASRLAALFLQHGVTHMASFFTVGKYGLFPEYPPRISLPARRYLCLFVGILIDDGIADFKRIKATPLELFLCSIAKPFPGLAYEHMLARALEKRRHPCLDGATIPQSHPDYSSNRELFERVLFNMRRALRSSVSEQKQQLQRDVANALKAVMEQMKADLRSLTNDASTHVPYMQFVRTIVPLIKQHDFCPVDSFFYQISSEFSPSSQDPHLQTAQILSYGLKLEDGDTRSMSTLFYFLYPNFKLAMTNGKLGQERSILREGLGNQHVFSFMLSRMLPAIIKTSVRVPEAWLMLETYVGSVEDVFNGFSGPAGADRPCIHREIGGESISDLTTLLKFVSTAINQLGNSSSMWHGAGYLHTLGQLIRLLNLFGPSIAAYLCLHSNAASQAGRALTKEITSFTDFTRAADDYISSALQVTTTSTGPLRIDPLPLLEEMQYYCIDPALEKNEHINNFSRHMEQDMRKTWCSTGSTISVKGPPNPSMASTQSGQGTVVPTRSLEDVVKELHKQLSEWNYTFDRSPATAWKRRPAISVEDLLF